MRRAAFDALEVIGPDAGEATPAVRKALKHADPITRRSAVTCLARIGPAAKEAAADLLEAWKDTANNQRRAILSALLKVGAGGQQSGRRRRACRTPASTCAWRGRAALRTDKQTRDILPVLIDMLRMRQEIAGVGRVLVQMGPASKEAVPFLINLLESPVSSHRYEAMRVLEEMADKQLSVKELAAHLVKTLARNEPSWRMQVARALRRLRSRSRRPWRPCSTS